YRTVANDGTGRPSTAVTATVTTTACPPSAGLGDTVNAVTVGAPVKTSVSGFEVDDDEPVPRAVTVYEYVCPAPTAPSVSVVAAVEPTVTVEPSGPVRRTEYDTAPRTVSQPSSTLSGWAVCHTRTGGKMVV